MSRIPKTKRRRKKNGWRRRPTPRFPVRIIQEATTEPGSQPK